MCFGVNCRFLFQVLRWFYQLAGLLLSMSSPLEYLDGFNPATLPAPFLRFLIHLYRFFSILFDPVFHFQHRASHRQRFGYRQFRFETPKYMSLCRRCFIWVLNMNSSILKSVFQIPQMSRRSFHFVSTKTRLLPLFLAQILCFMHFGA